MPSPVYIDVLPIPDRIEDGDMCRIAIQLTPTRRPRPSGDIDVSNWPTEIAGRIQQIRLHVASYENGSIVNSRDPIDLVTDLKEIYEIDGVLLKASQKWKETFCVEEVDWDGILGELDDPNSIDPSAEESLEYERLGLLLKAAQSGESVGGPAGSVVDDVIARVYRQAQRKDVEHELGFHNYLRSPGRDNSIYRKRPTSGAPWQEISESLGLEERHGTYVATWRARLEERFSELERQVYDDPSSVLEGLLAGFREVQESIASLDRFLDDFDEGLSADAALDEALDRLRELGQLGPTAGARDVMGAFAHDLDDSGFFASWADRLRAPLSMRKPCRRPALHRRRSSSPVLSQPRRPPPRVVSRSRPPARSRCLLLATQLPHRPRVCAPSGWSLARRNHGSRSLVGPIHDRHLRSPES